MKNTFKVIIAGGRDFVPKSEHWEILDNLVAKKIKAGYTIEVVCGEAKGGDAFGKLWATTRGHIVTSFFPKWDVYGKRAGHFRNKEMGNYANALVAFWEGFSGTRHMIGYMAKLNKPIRVFNYAGVPQS